MTQKDEDLKQALDQEAPTEGHSFDELAKGIVNSTLSRGQVFKLVGAAVLGSALSSALPGVAVAKKKKKKHKRRPRACTVSDCSRCGPSRGHSCVCVPSNNGNPTCIDTKKGTFPPCTTNTDCPTGSICIEAFVCGAPPGTFFCAFPCGS